MARGVAIVPHTHWDREWYSPFQSFRLRLVEVLDDLLPRLEADPSYAHFLLDGQMAVVDDYLAVRPEAEARLRHLASNGRLAMGPWYVLMDEFLVSGETIVRDLQLGLERAAQFGGAMPVGYLPDMFGHIAQMPQLLQQFGFDDAVVWRGVPLAVDRTAFWWSSPDGSTVRAEYLPNGYGNGAVLPDDGKALLERISTWIDSHHEIVRDAPVLIMNGSDHLAPQAFLGNVVSEANAVQDDLALEVTSLAAYLATAPRHDLPRWQGELRSGARANLLMGVASNRADVRRAAAATERSLERLAEPLSALFLPPEAWPGELLDQAWLEVIRNAAHDSICACSVDEVCDAVLHRYAEARQIAEGLTGRAVRALGKNLQRHGPVALNPSARTRSGLVTITVDADAAGEHGQVIGHRGGEQLLWSLPAENAASVLHDVIEWTRDLYHVDVERQDDGSVDVRAYSSPGAPRLVTQPTKARIDELATANPKATFRYHVHEPARTVMLARVTDVPGFGWRPVDLQPLDVPPVVVHDTVLSTPALTNGLVSIEVDTATATFAITDADGQSASGLGRLVDDGDEGDTYNYSPPAFDSVVDWADSCTVMTLEQGPLRGALLMTARYHWPECIEDGERIRGRDVTVATLIELRAGERFVRITVELDNQCRDHRLRAWFPLVTPASASRAECAFAVVERGLVAEGGPTEVGLPTFPSRRFVSAGGVTIAHEGIVEYELVDIHDGSARALALTLLRATGFLSRGPMALRALPAGPIIEMEGSQVRGVHRWSYAVALGDVDPYALVDEASLPMPVAVGQGRGNWSDVGDLLRVDGAEVSAVRRVGGSLEVRVFNPTSDEVRVDLGHRGGWIVDLRGRPQEPVEGGFALGPWKIATIRLR